MIPKKYPLAIIPAVLFGLLVVGVASAQQPLPTPSDDQVNAIARQLYCPVCENTPLDVCPTTACAQWRDLIRQKLAAGWSDQAIKDYFVNQYGARVLGTPPPKGLNLLVYIIPPIAILAGVY
ncbi:MAG TPA: cytochrome c-type biogenesis protein CcmH, partial [Anaerolineales bacterium]|nr:cytochrome c-type biogenesis protein CcmH [Anaerolineales bacterium]